VPELPDLVVYIEALQGRLCGRSIERVRVTSPFVLRSVDPPLAAIAGATVRDVSRVGKRIVIEFDQELFLVLHLMIAGRLRWREPNQALPVAPRQLLASFELQNGTLFFTEAGSHKRASMQMVRGRPALRALDRGGVEPLDATVEEFREALVRENHTLKRALTDPRLISGIGNAYSDEILHAARLSPLKLTRTLNEEEVKRLFDATQGTLRRWIDRLREDGAERFPDKVTAFRDGMAVHGRFRQPCPVCGAPVQRIVHATNESNYCPVCQTGGRVLADRSLSRLLGKDWPRTVDEL
jgi:formamidopyrimidine-DNA glycosylase